jgi:AAA+ ATPase superfamily predicted ATPase
MFQKMVGRLREQEILTDALNSHRSELIAIYGRRKIGKTYLVRSLFGKQITFSFTGLSNGKRTNQIKNYLFKSIVKKCCHGSKYYSVVFKKTDRVICILYF